MQIAYSVNKVRKKLNFVIDDIVQVFKNHERLVDCTEAVISVLLSIFVAHQLHVAHVGWAAFSGYMVMRSHVIITLERGLLRVMGTILGGLLALNIGPLFNSPLYSGIMLAMVSFICIYCALVAKRGYVWVFFGITFSMVCMDGIQHGVSQINHFAYNRMLEICIGTSCCVIVSALSTWFIRPRIFSEHIIKKGLFPLAYHRVWWHRKAFFHAFQGAIAMMLVPLVWHDFGVMSLSQTVVTIMAVMAIPLSSLDLAVHPSSMKIRHRLAGCLCGGMVAFVFISISYNFHALVLIFIAIGIFIGRSIENSRALSFKYAGTQFSLGLLIVLTPDHYSLISVEPGVQRLLGIFAGVILLEPVRMLTRRLIK
ncbi:FUSC family protein [Salmonella enterica]|nr:FUSC family protein [Salmonella enterica]